MFNLNKYFVLDLFWPWPWMQMTLNTFETGLVRLHLSNPIIWYQTWHDLDNFEFWPYFWASTYFDLDLWPRWLQILSKLVQLYCSCKTLSFDTKHDIFWTIFKFDLILEPWPTLTLTFDLHRHRSSWVHP